MIPAMALQVQQGSRNAFPGAASDFFPRNPETNCPVANLYTTPGRTITYE
ncbi:hypothetical protein ASZ90_015314 [hydrocarbon metagenome]|uniref:Uncharacterized protein n=1 Tax=hydrocarbon metagenome TaxID=938273 RepID=A0A0W8F284_9ZZZZ